MMLIGAVPASALATPETTVSEYASPASVEISGTVQGGQTVEAVITADAVPQPTSYSYRWYVDDQEILDATAQTLTIDPWNVDSRLTVMAIPELDGYGAESGTGTSPASDPVAPAVHSGRLTVALPETIQASQVVSAVLGGDLSPEPTHTDYTWLVDGIPVPDAWEQTLDVGQIGISVGSTLAVTAASAAYGYMPVEATSAAVTVLPAPTVDAEVVNLPDGLGIRLVGTFFLDVGTLTVELHDDPLTPEEASSPQTLDPDPIILGTVEPDGDGRFTFEAPFDPTAGAIRFVVRDAQGTVFFFQNMIFVGAAEPEPAPAQQPDEATGPRLADSGGPSMPAGAAAAAAILIVAGVALAWTGSRRRRIRSS